MATLASAALAAALIAAPSPQWAQAATASGASGGLLLPSPSVVPEGKLSVGLGFDFWRGSGFLFTDTRTQRSGGSFTLSGSAAPWLELFSGLSLHSTNLFSEASRRTLVSFGDLDLGAKLIIPGPGPISAGVLLEVDVPSGVGGFSLKGTGGRAAALFGWAGRFFRASLLAGYRVDNTGRLLEGTPATFPAWALGLSSYDRAEGGFAVQVPLRLATPSVELAADSPVARRTPLPDGSRPVRARLALGVSEIHTGLASLTASAAVQLSLTNGGSVADRALPTPGFAPDAPWTALFGLTWTFQRPALPKLRAREPDFAEKRAAPSESARPAVVQVVKAREKAVLRVVVLDARTQLPIAGAWVSFVEGSEIGATTGPDGKARIEADAGSVTLAVARDTYELLTEPVVLAAGEEKSVSVSLTSVAPDAIVRGKIVGEDGAPLRASIYVGLSGALPALPGAGGIEPTIFEGSYSFPVRHGSYDITAYTPGYRADPQSAEARPGETVTRDLLLRRIAGEPRARLGPQGVELSEPVAFALAREAIDPGSMLLLAELAQVLKNEKRPLRLIARVAAAEVLDEAAAFRLADARAAGVADYLRDKGVKPELLQPRGGGVANPGQPLLELLVAPEPQKPRSSLLPHRIYLGGLP